MMKTLSRWFLAVLCLGAASGAAAAEKPLRVVATLSTFADLARTVGGEFVDVSAVASPKFNAHFIEPKPSDVLKVKRAELFIHGGLDLEAWRGPLLDAAGNREAFPGGGKELDLSRGIPLLDVPEQAPSRAEGDIHLYGNPHYWTDPENAVTMARAICDKLSSLDPAHADAFRRNLAAFQDRLAQRMGEWRTRLAPYQGRELVGYHNEWPYLMRFAGLTMERFLEPKPGIAPTPRQLELLEHDITGRGIRAIVQPSYAPRQAAAALAKRTGAAVVTLCQHVGELDGCGDYIGMLDHNVDRLVSALEERHE